MKKKILILVVLLFNTICLSVRAAKIPDGNVGDFSIRTVKGICYLYEGKEKWMSNNAFEKRSMQFAVDKCEGKILIGGLGLGLIVEALAKKEEVTEMVVVEIAPEVIELVWEYLETKEKAITICDDIFNYLEVTEEKFDYIYLDVWDTISEKIYRDIVLPLRKLSEKLVPAENVLCWQEEEMRKAYGVSKDQAEKEKEK